MNFVSLLSYIWRVFEDTEHNGQKKQAMKETAHRIAQTWAHFYHRKF